MTTLLRSPAHTVETSGGCVRVRIELPEVEKVSAVELDIGVDRLQLSVPGLYLLDLTLPLDELAAPGACRAGQHVNKRTSDLPPKSGSWLLYTKSTT